MFRYRLFISATLCLMLSILLAACGGEAVSDSEPAPEDKALAVYEFKTNPDPVGPVGQDASKYVRTFTEEFDGKLDTSVWNTGGWYGNDTVNYAIENGALKIWPQRDGTGKFFKRMLDTYGNFSQAYGYFEIEAKLPKGKATSPAFWLYNQFGERRPEIDIMQAYPGTAGWGKRNATGVPAPTSYAVAVWTDARVNGGGKRQDTPDLSQAFHKYGLKWEPDKLTFYFDGKEVYSVNSQMSDPLYIVLDLWSDGGAGSQDLATPCGKSNSYQVNYVRAWQFK